MMAGNPKLKVADEPTRRPPAAQATWRTTKAELSPTFAQLPVVKARAMQVPAAGGAASIRFVASLRSP